LQLRGLPVLLLLSPVLQLLLLCGVLGWLPRRPEPVSRLPVVVLQRDATFLLQVPVVVLRGRVVLPRHRHGSVLPRFVPQCPCPGGAVVPGVLLRLRVLLLQVQRMPLPVLW
jgi:hypothetical protein